MGWGSGLAFMTGVFRGFSNAFYYYGGGYDYYCGYDCAPGWFCRSYSRPYAPPSEFYYNYSYPPPRPIWNFYGEGFYDRYADNDCYYRQDSCGAYASGYEWGGYIGNDCTEYRYDDNSRYSYQRVNTNNRAVNSSNRTRHNSNRFNSNITPANRSATPSGNGNCRYEYGNIPKDEALWRAAADSRLEAIGGGGTGWSCSSASFANDITYATKGTSRLLDAVVAKIRETDPNFTLLITSALGTAGSPHGKSYTNSHYNPDNVKLDFGGSLNRSQANEVARKLKATGYFQFAKVEYNGGNSGTYHIDAMFKPEWLAKARNGEI